MGFCPMHNFCWNLPSLCFICAIKHSIVCGALMPRTGSIWLGYTNWKASGINPKYLALNRTIGNRQIHRPSADGSVYIRPMDRHRPMGKKFTIVWTLLQMTCPYKYKYTTYTNINPYTIGKGYTTHRKGNLKLPLLPRWHSSINEFIHAFIERKGCQSTTFIDV